MLDILELKKTNYIWMIGYVCNENLMLDCYHLDNGEINKLKILQDE